MSKESTKSARRMLITSAQESVKILVVTNNFKGTDPKATTYTYLVDSHDPVGTSAVAQYAEDNGYIQNVKSDIVQHVAHGLVAAIIRLASNGRPVTLDGLLSIRIVAKGGTDDPELPFREGKNAALYFNAIVSPTLNQSANELDTHVEGLAPDRSIITSVFSPINDSTVEFGRGYDIILKGHNIKIVPEKDPDYGLVYINNTTGVAYPFTGNHALNTPSQIISFIPPSIPYGSYRIELHTKYTHGNKELKTPKVIHYSEYIEVSAITKDVQLAEPARKAKDTKGKTDTKKK